MVAIQPFGCCINGSMPEYPQVRVVAVIEPDSLANLVTNLSDQRCATADPVYRRMTVYAIQKLSQPNIYLYLDAGHAGWLGWPANISPAAQLFGNLLKTAGGPYRVRGLATSEYIVIGCFKLSLINLWYRRRELQCYHRCLARSGHSS